MTTSLPTNGGVEVEDIFAAPAEGPARSGFATGDAGGPAVLTPETFVPVAETEVETTTTSEPVPGRKRRWLLIVAISLGGLLLLGGIGLAVLYSVQRWRATALGRTDATNQVNTSATANTPLITTTTPETNTNTSSTGDAFVDGDHDGLSDQEELLHNTNPKKRDTDEDGLSDREEVRVYLTDPRNPDTDSDGYTDGNEVANFYHPNDPNPTKRLFDIP